jgi:hypothetical protein
MQLEARVTRQRRPEVLHADAVHRSSQKEVSGGVAGALSIPSGAKSARRGAWPG